MDVYQILYEICEDKRVFDPEIDLVETGLMDSYAMIELFSILEENGIEIQPTRINRQLLHTVKGIETLINNSKSM